MAKSKKITKKDLINEYVKIKKKLGINSKINLITFIKENKLINSKYWFEKNQVKYTDFLIEADKKFVASLPKAQKALLSEQAKRFDPNITKDQCIDDLRAVQEREPLCFISRTTYRNNGSYSDSTWNQHFGTFQEFRRQAGLELTRQQHKLEREIAKHASVDHYENYITSEVMPYLNKYPKNSNKKSHHRKMLVASDIHDKDANRFALSVFIDTCKKTQPDVIVLNGDIADCPEFGKYAKDPRDFSLVERHDFLKNQILKPIRESCPNAQIDYVMGNHEFRILRHLADASPYMKVVLADVMGIRFKDFFCVDEFKINWVSKCDLTAFSYRDAKDQFRANYQIYYGCYIVCHEFDKNLFTMSGTNGHHHQLEAHSSVDIERGSITWMQTPGLCNPDAEYLKNKSRWNMGFIEVDINLKESQVIQTPHLIHEEWAIVNGLYYAEK